MTPGRPLGAPGLAWGDTTEVASRVNPKHLRDLVLANFESLPQKTTQGNKFLFYLNIKKLQRDSENILGMPAQPGQTPRVVRGPFFSLTQPSTERRECSTHLLSERRTRHTERYSTNANEKKCSVSYCGQFSDRDGVWHPETVEVRKGRRGKRRGPHRQTHR